MAKLSSTDAAKKWSTRTQAAIPDYTKGIAAVTNNPMDAAKLAIPKYLQGVQDAVSSGKLAKGLGRVSLTDWQNKAKTLGASRIAAGVTAAVTKMTDFYNAFLPFLDSVTASTRAMPDNTLADRINRAVNQMTKTATFPGY